jgi:ADP-heptose:LPS heptosyltransferase
VKNLLAVRLDSDGDVLLTGPAIRALAAEGRITLLCGPRGRQAGSLLPGVDELIVYDACWISPEPEPLDPAQTLQLVERIRSQGFDQAIVFTSFHQSPLPTALLLRMAGLPVVAAISEDYPGSLLDVRHRADDRLHEVERALSLAATLGYALPEGDDGSLKIKRAAKPPGDLPERYVVVHPGASVPARAWPPALHAELVRALVAGGHRVVVTGGPGERALTRQVCGTPHPDIVDVGGRLNLSELAAVIAGAEVVVVGNTGPAHLAAAVGTPVVSLFAPTVPLERWRPWRVPQVVLGDQRIPCAGCRSRVCPFEGHPCLTAVGVPDVVQAVDELGGRSSHPQDREAVLRA